MGRPRKTNITLAGPATSKTPDLKMESKIEGKARIACDPAAYDYSNRRRDVIRDLVYGNVAPKSTVAKVLGEGGARFVGMRIADTPLDYLMHRTERRLDPEQYEAGTRWRTLLEAQGATGTSNTAAVIARMQMSVPPDAADRRYVKEGGEFMACRDDSGSGVDPTGRILSVSFMVRRVREKLETRPVDAALVTLFIEHEMTIGQIATAWGETVDYTGRRVREALWSLATVMMEVDHEY